MHIISYMTFMIRKVELMIFCYLIFSFTIYSSTSFDTSLRKNIDFDFLCTENGFYWSRCYFTMNVFIYWWHNMTLPHCKMILLDAFIIWCSLSKLVNTSLYFFPSFSKTGLFNLSILYAKWAHEASHCQQY